MKTMQSTSPFKVDQADLKKLSRREINKLNKRLQIKLAAKKIFGEEGFEGATLRDIANKANVGLGTVMLYAQDKRDLVLLMYNDEIEDALKIAGSKINASKTTLDNLISFFQVFYQRYADNLRLARTYLQINFFSEGMNTAALKVHRAHKRRLVATIIEFGQARGTLRTDIAPEKMAEQVLLLHRAAVRSWIADEKPNVKSGLSHLREILFLQIEGFGLTQK